ncbi:MAG: hypothetical protein RL701_7315 [Pseudomonadota bacterium]|jgi:hypothetical protein
MAGKHKLLGVTVITILSGCYASHDTNPGETTVSYKSENAAGDTTVRQAGRASPDSLGAAGRAALGARPAEQTPADTSDVTFQFDVDVPAGGELLRCVYAQMPSDRGVIAVPKVESHYTPGSHHLLAYRSNLTAIPEGKGSPWDCSDGAWQLNQRGAYYEAQQPNEERALPPGIAHKFAPGEIMILQAHYVNARDEELSAHVELTLHPMDPAQVEQEAGTIFFTNVNITVPPHSKATAGMRCTLPQDISLALLWSHMHKRGVHFVATTDDPPAAAALGTLYEAADWNEPKQREYPTDPAVILHAGSHITFACDYQNDSELRYVFGNSAETNEMCILHGMYWPRMPVASEQCLFGATFK